MKRKLRRKLKQKRKGKASSGRTATKYDYPLVDGREMTSEEKKKYRMAQRKLAAGKTPKESKPKEEPKKESKRISLLRKIKRPKILRRKGQR